MGIFSKRETVTEEQAFKAILTPDALKARILNIFGYKVHVVMTPLVAEPILLVPQASSRQFESYLERRFGRPLDSLEEGVPESFREAHHE